MCGNVWEMTDEYDDGHHYYLILKGGSYYSVDERGYEQYPIVYARRYPPRPWRHGEYQHYRDSRPQPATHHLRYLLMDASLDRSKTVGFRCVRDL
jgi:hypothetical protein